MKVQLRNYLAVIGAVILTLTLHFEAEAQFGGGGRLTGTWDAEVEITNCQTGDMLASFKSIGAFHQGGTFNGITAGTPPAARTPEIGIWRHNLDNTYTLRFKAFLFNPMGQPVGYQIITHTVELGRDNQSYTSVGSAKIFALDGTQTGSVCSSAVATRMSFD